MSAHSAYSQDSMSTRDMSRRLTTTHRRRQRRQQQLQQRHAPQWAALLLLAIFSAMFSCASAQDFTVEGLVDIEQCSNGMTQSDTDGDGQLSRIEYLAFVKALSPPNFLTSIDRFVDLPLPLIANFNNLACFCNLDPETPDKETCCVGQEDFIEIPGSDPLTDRDKVILFTMCSFTKDAIDRAILDEPPSVAPSAAPTTTPSPVQTPTEAPSGSSPVTTEVARVGYTVGIRSSDEPADFAEYSPLLIQSMGDLAPDVLTESLGSRRRLRVNYQRKLQTVTSSTLTGPISDGCPEGSTAIDGDTCEEVDAVIAVVFPSAEAVPAGFQQDFEAALSTAINQGRLQDALALINSNAPVYIVVPATGAPIVPPGGGGSTLGTGPLAGIIIGSAAVVGVLIAALVLRRRSKDEPYDDLSPGDLATTELQLDDAHRDMDGPSSIMGMKKHPLQTEVDGIPAPVVEAGDDDDDDDDAPEMESLHDSSSNAGSSGWSSSAGVSSLNTGSADGLDEPGVPTAGVAGSSALAAMGVGTRAVAANDNVPVIPTVTRADLDSAIEAGDWAAVGATAALLAAASDSQSYSSKSRDETRDQQKSESSFSSVDASRAAELDHLVDAGDWEGIVLAAAKYEAAEGNSQSGHSPSVASGSESRGSRSSVGESGTFVSGSTSFSHSSSPSKLKKRQELRSQVEELVRRVVPEEIENVDEMMAQFRGREEELVETLRTMQERAVAQKARVGAQKAAKQEAKRAVRANRRDLASTGAAAGAGAASSQAASSSDATSAADTTFEDAAGGVRSISLGVGTAQPKMAPRSPAPEMGTATSAAAGAGGAVAGAAGAAAIGVTSAAAIGGAAVLGALATPALAVAAVASLDKANKDSGDSDGKPPAVPPKGAADEEIAPEDVDIFLKPSVDSPSKPFTDDVPSPASTPNTSPKADADSPSGSFPMSARSLGSGEVYNEAETPDSREIKQSVLEKAIEAGDWEAVGEAAAMLSDNSMTSADTDEVDRLARGISSGSSAGSEGKGVNADRAAELDDLIEKGDWTGVVAAASRYSNDDNDDEKPQRTESFISRQQKQREQEERRQRRLQRMKEEQDALEQAEIWMAIAEQSKQETEMEATGASDAADWAIARSLSLLVRAEQGGQLQDTPNQSDASQAGQDEEEV